VNDELGECRVELGIGKRQLFSGSDAYVNSDMARTCCGGELFRRIHCRNGSNAETSDEFCCQCPRAAADVEHTVARRDAGEVRERRRQPNGVATYETVVGTGSNGEAHHSIQG
jgi:hypothetical protein